MARIYWTEEEKQVVARASFEHRINEMGLADWVCVDRAQQRVLPIYRHRVLNSSVAHLPWLKAMWSEMMIRMKAGELEPLPPSYVAPTPVVQAPVVSEPPVVRSLHIELTDPLSLDSKTRLTWKPHSNGHEPRYSEIVAQRIKPLVDPRVERDYASSVKEPDVRQPAPVPAKAPAANLGGVNTQDLIIELMTRMTQILDPEAMKAQMEQIANDAITARVSALALIRQEPKADVVELNSGAKHNPEQQGGPRVELAKVLILGLTSSQEGMLSNEYPGINFYFLSGMEGIRRIENTHKAVELTLKTNWVKGHLSTGGWRNLIQVNGFDGIRRALKEKFNMVPLR